MIRTSFSFRFSILELIVCLCLCNRHLCVCIVTKIFKQNQIEGHPPESSCDLYIIIKLIFKAHYTLYTLNRPLSFCYIFINS
jgi:hypothetical protein